MGGNPAGPFSVGADQGDAFWYLGGRIVYKCSSEQTGGWGLSVETYPPGFAAALHVHETEDSGFYVLSGVMRVRAGEQEFVAGSGDFAFLPRGIPHAFRVGPEEPVVWLNIQGPTGDFRRLVEETGEPAAGLGLPDAARAPDPEAAALARERHNLKLISPPPF